MILIKVYALFIHLDYGSVVRAFIIASLATFCISVLQMVLFSALSINILFATPTSQFILYSFVPAS